MIRVLALAAAALAIPELESPLETVRALDAAYATSYSARDYKAVAALFSADAHVVAAGGFLVGRPKLGAYFAAHAHANYSRAPVVVRAGGAPDFALHEIGNSSGGLFYARWIKPHAGWEIAFLAPLGGEWGVFGPPVGPANATNVTRAIAALDGGWSADYARRAWRALAGRYAPAALLVGPAAATFATNTTAFFTGLADDAGYVRVDRAPLVTAQQTTTLVHEIGTANYTSWYDPYAGRGVYYARYERPNATSDDWRVVLDVLSVSFCLW